MSGSLVVPALRVLIDILRDRQTGQDVEKELSDQLGQRIWTVKNYKNEEVRLSVESISVRPKYSPKSEVEGVKQYEADNFFTRLEGERTEVTLLEKLRAVATNQWITIVQLRIEDGEAVDLRPSGLNLGYVAMITSLHFDAQPPNSEKGIVEIPQIRVAETHDLQSDKLEIKIRYNGSISEYNQRLADTIDLLRYIQDEMDRHVIEYLLALHHSGKVENGEYSWPDEQRARDLGRYLVGCSVDIDHLWETMERTKADIRSTAKE